METKAITTASTHSALQIMPTASGHNILLSNEEYPIYHLHITRFLTEYRPETAREAELVQCLADTEWRLQRLSRLEMGIFARGHIEFGNLFVAENPNVRTLLIEQHTMFTYARQLNSLGLQEARLRRYFNEGRAALIAAQQTRKDKDKEKAAAAAAHNAPEASLEDRTKPHATGVARSRHQPDRQRVS